MTTTKITRAKSRGGSEVVAVLSGAHYVRVIRSRTMSSGTSDTRPARPINFSPRPVPKGRRWLYYFFRLLLAKTYGSVLVYRVSRSGGLYIPIDVSYLGMKIFLKNKKKSRHSSILPDRPNVRYRVSAFVFKRNDKKRKKKRFCANIQFSAFRKYFSFYSHLFLIFFFCFGKRVIRLHALCFMV